MPTNRLSELEPEQDHFSEIEEQSTGPRPVDRHGDEKSDDDPDDQRPFVQLPGTGRLASEFAEEMACVLKNAVSDKICTNAGGRKRPADKMPDPKDSRQCFLCLWNGRICSIKRDEGSMKQHSGLVINHVDTAQSITFLENWVRTGKIKHVSGQELCIPESMKPPVAATLLASAQLQDALPRVDRLLDFALPYGFVRSTKPISNTSAQELADSSPSLSKPNGKCSAGIMKMRAGFGRYIQKNGEMVNYYCNRELEHSLSLEQAKIVIKKLFSEFSFADDQSQYHAIARLLTPYCQGLMGWRKRSPLWIFTADRPRAGKDYLAMITPLVHSQWAVQDPPLESDDEVKRRITAALASGRRFMHFANCRRELDHSSLEAAITCEFWSDRVIRSSNEVTVPNEIIFSLSYNGALPMTLDLAARSRQIRLKGKQGSPNSHKYRMSNLHDMVARFNSSSVPNPKPKESQAQQNAELDADPAFKKLEAKTQICRRNILAALDALIRNWASHNCPHGPTFTSFPEWSHVVGGIMLAAELGDPCQEDANLIEATCDDWKDDLASLAEAVCVTEEYTFFNTGELVERYIVKEIDKYSVFNAYIRQYDLKIFSIQLGKQFKHYTGKPLKGKAAVYWLRQHELRNPPKYQFFVKERSDCNGFSQDPGGHFDEYEIIS